MAAPDRTRAAFLHCHALPRKSLHVLTNLFLLCVPQAGALLERAGHLQVTSSVLDNASESPCLLALLPRELTTGQDLLSPLQLWLRVQRGVGLYVGAVHRVGMYSCIVAPRSGGMTQVDVPSRLSVCGTV